MDIEKTIQDNVDILEDRIPRELLTILLLDHTTGKNLLWGTDINHNEKASIQIDDIVGENGLILRPRVRKSEDEKRLRTKKRAEVFTPSWVCNEQLNAADRLWFYGKTKPISGSPFNTVNGKTWKPTTLASICKVFEKTKKDWKQYILEDRIEMCCGEGPYLVSRYDVVTEREIPVNERIGILDRKLRVINAFLGVGSGASKSEWLEWVKKAYQHTYGFEWQGDNLLLTREALLFTFLDNLREYNLSCSATQHDSNDIECPNTLKAFDMDCLRIDDFEHIKAIAEIISWNFWQMDGLTGCTPYTKPSIDFKKVISNLSKSDSGQMFDKMTYVIPAEFCRIMDWDENVITTYAEVYAEAIKNRAL